VSACVASTGIDSTHTQHTLNKHAEDWPSQVVDVLADITNGTHPRPGDEPQQYHFMQAFYPYVLLYIVAYFFQVAFLLCLQVVSAEGEFLCLPLCRLALQKANTLQKAPTLLVLQCSRPERLSLVADQHAHIAPQ